MKNEKKEYFIGLDVGTSSVGWAVTDTNYNVIKIHNQKAWGARLFDEAKDAKERRTFRSNRRRKDRALWRRDIIRELFAKEINKIDESFFVRLDNSTFIKEDKDEVLEDTNTIFADKDYKDKNYHEKFPTIYHLRKELMDEKKPHDVRLVYLAVSHIVKNRGHFLFENLAVEDENSKSFDIAYDEAINSLISYFDNRYGVNINDLFEDKLKYIISSDETKNDKKAEVTQILKTKENLDKNIEDNIKSFVNLVFGSKVDISSLIVQEDEDSDEEKISIEFEKETFEDDLNNIKNKLDDDLYNLIVALKKLYDSNKICKILKNSESISDAKVKSYKDHKKQLELLKKIIKANLPKEYDKFFKNSNENNNYVSYIGMNKENHVKKYIKRCKKDEFYKNLNKILKSIEPTTEEIQKALIDIENGNFLPLQRNSDNGVLPRQLHEYELKKILDNAKEYLPFLNEKDEYGTVIDKIIKTFEFRIPYYIGPLNPYHKKEEKSKNRKGAWVTMHKKEGEKIRPWNYMDFVDEEKTAQDFIVRMTNKCVYLHDEDVLPKNSMIYQEYMVLNEINNLVIKGEKINKEIKQKVLELYKSTKHVKLKNIVDKLVSDGFYRQDELKIDDITGINKSTDLVASLESYHKMKEFFGNDVNNDNVKEIIEKIIFYLTIYNDGGKIAQDRINKEFKDVLFKYFGEGEEYNKKLKKLVKLNMSGWGRFSKAFLELEGANVETGEKVTIMHELRNTSKNLMEIIATGDYNFCEILSEYNKKENDKISYSLVEEEYVSPSVKRAIWQTLKIVDEIVKLKGYEPSKIFVEMARSEEEKKETVSRKKQLEYLYESIKYENIENLKIELGKETDATLRRKALYLYYTQLGKDMYTGLSINLSELHNANVYDIDHIYPKSKSGQDSITKNLVLVSKKVNDDKKDIYPLPDYIRKNNYGFWKLLKEKNLITAEKFNRLTRTTPFTNEELGGFIEKQLVETRQSTKVIKNILSTYYQNTKIVCVHANRVSEFRHGVIVYNKNGIENQAKEFLKVREINDFHHAKDAYLNIVVGNVYNTKYTDNPAKWIKQQKEESIKNYSLTMTYAFDVKDMTNKEKFVWKAGLDGTIKTVEKNMSHNDIKVTVMPIENKGQFYKQNIISKTENPNIPLKGLNNKLSNPSRYGGYKGKETAFFVVYSFDEVIKTLEKKTLKETKKIKNFLCIDTIPIYYLKSLKNDKNYELKIIDYFKEKNHIKEDEKKKQEVSYTNYKLLIKKIKKNTKIQVGNFVYYLIGDNGNISVAPAYEYVLENDFEIVIKKIIKYVNDLQIKNNKIDISNYGIEEKDLIALYDKLILDLGGKVYCDRSANPYSKLIEKHDIYLTLNSNEKAKVIYAILHLFKCKIATGADLKLISLGERVGENMTISKNINNKKEVKIIYESVTGLYKKEININGLANS